MKRSSGSRPITREWIYQNTNCGVPTRIQAEVLGIEYPLRSGWINRLVGTDLSDQAMNRFEYLHQCQNLKLAAKRHQRALHDRRHSPPPIREPEEASPCPEDEVPWEH